jgi:TPR repeat protein
MPLFSRVVLAVTGVAVISAALTVGWVHKIDSIRSKKLADTATETHARADQGDLSAEYSLACMYYEGRGVPQDYAEASRWYRKAAEQGYAKAQFGLGDLYLQGKGVPQDYAETARWNQKAAAQGYARAQAGLGYMYLKGVGVSQDYAEAFHWYGKAADQGNVDAEHALGYIYLNGIGVPQDYHLAVPWIQKAADQGDPEAQATIGSMYASGLGLPKNEYEAYRWFHKAAEKGDPKAKSAIERLGRESVGKMRWVELCMALVGLVVGLWAALEFLLPGKTLSDRRQVAVTLFGVVLLSNAGLSLYNFAHYNLRFSPQWHAFHIARYMFAAALIPLAAIVVLPFKRDDSGASGEAGASSRPDHL